MRESDISFQEIEPSKLTIFNWLFAEYQNLVTNPNLKFIIYAKKNIIYNNIRNIFIFKIELFLKNIGKINNTNNMKIKS